MTSKNIQDRLKSVISTHSPTIPTIPSPSLKTSSSSNLTGKPLESIELNTSLSYKKGI